MDPKLSPKRHFCSPPSEAEPLNPEQQRLHALSSCAMISVSSEVRGCCESQPDAHALISHTMREEFSRRPSYVDAFLAWKQVKKGRASSLCAWSLYGRGMVQRFLFNLGCWIQKRFKSVLFSGLLILLALIGLTFYFNSKGLMIESNIEKLWVEKGGRLDEERAFVRQMIGGTVTSLSHTPKGAKRPPTETPTASLQVVIQTPLRGHGENILTREDFLAHLDLMLNITQMSVFMFGHHWRLSDLCFKPEAPPIEGEYADMLNHLLEPIVPCAMITPLDCFWEGSKPLGPFPPIDRPHIVEMFLPGMLEALISWKNLNPRGILEKLDEYGILEHLQGVRSFFDRAGITTAFQEKPCLNAFDAECPQTSPNFRKNESIDFSHILSSGCQGFAAKLMRFPDDLIFGGVMRNKQKKIMKVEALETIVLLAPPVDVYRRWEFSTKHARVEQHVWQEVWTVEAATELLTAWQRNFSELIYNSPFNRDQEVRNAFARANGHLTLPVHKKYASEEPSWFASNRQQHLHQVKAGVHAMKNSMFKNEKFPPNDASEYDGEEDSPQNLTWSAERAAKGEETHEVEQDDGESHEGLQEAATTQTTVDLATLLHRKSAVEPMFHPFAGTSVNDMLAEFSKFKVDMIVLGYFLMIIYAAVSLVSLRRRGIDSAIGLAFAGCLLVTMATVAGLAFALFVGIQFNAATTQIVPFLSLGLGVDDMFLLVHNFQKVVRESDRDEIGYLLKETGVSVLITSVSNVFAFSTAGTFLPVPALRSFCYQIAILLSFNVVAIVLVYPAMMAWDLERRKRLRTDIFCCVKVNADRISPVIGEEEEDDEGRDTEATTVESDAPDVVKQAGRDGRTRSTQTDAKQTKSTRRPWTRKSFSLKRFVRRFYAPLLTRLPVKVGVILLSTAFLGMSLVALSRLVLGLELADVIPKGTAPYDFVSTREKYFPFYPMTLVIKGEGMRWREANTQRLLFEYYQEISAVKYVIKENDGGSRFWLPMMRDWLISLQLQLNKALLDGHVSRSGFKCSADGEFLANDDAILAYKLLVNAGDVVDPLRLGREQLIDQNGFVNHESFFNVLTAWYHLDRMTYYVSQANFVPLPQPAWKQPEKGLCRPKSGNFYAMTREELKIPPAEKLSYSQLAFFVNGLVDTPAIVEMIQTVRSVCEGFDARGLPNFPEGIPFTYWEQYVYLVANLVKCLAIIVAGIFGVLTVFLMNPHTAFVTVAFLVVMTAELAGFMSVVGLKLNSVSAVTLISAVGIGVEFTVHICFSYLTALGDSNERLVATLDHMFVPVLHGGLSTALGILMLAFSEFEFVVWYFFVVLIALIVIGLLNGLVVLPVLLTFVGPKSEVSPRGGVVYLSPPTPKLQPQRVKTNESFIVELRDVPPTLAMRDTCGGSIATAAGIGNEDEADVGTPTPSPPPSVKCQRTSGGRHGREKRVKQQPDNSSLSAISEESSSGGSPPVSATPTAMMQIQMRPSTFNVKMPAASEPLTLTGKNKVELCIRAGNGVARASGSTSERRKQAKKAKATRESGDIPAGTKT